MGELDRGVQAAHPLDVRTEEHRLRALELRGEGKSYRKIADALGIDVHRAHDLVTEGLDQLIVQSAETAEQVRVLELGRLDDLLDRLVIKLSLQRKAMATADGKSVNVPDPEERTVDAILRVMERRAKLLGLDAPQEIVGAGGGPLQISNVTASEEFLGRVEKLVARLAAGETPDAVAASLKPVEPEAVPSTNGVHG